MRLTSSTFRNPCALPRGRQQPLLLNDDLSVNDLSTSPEVEHCDRLCLGLEISDPHTLAPCRSSLDCATHPSNMSQTCCTCALPLPASPTLDLKTEKPLPSPRTLPCCSRIICSRCQHTNPRFTTYCPFCQISTGLSSLPSEGLRLPPSYNQTETSLRSLRDFPPAYESIASRPDRSTSHSEPPRDTPDTVHHLSADHTLQSLSLAYNVPVPVLRQHNRITSDSLLSAHKWLLIPSSYYQGPSLSTPPDPEEEERKNKLRRFMVATKCPEYNVAQLYLKGSDWDLEIAIESFKEDERWEKEHPIKNGENDKGKSKRRIGGSGSLVGQLR